MSKDRKNWYSIENKASETKKTKVYIYEEIGLWGVTAKEFIDDIADIKGDWDLHLNTGGGSIFEGFAMYNAIKNHPGTVSGYVDGLAASMGSYIMLACDTVEIAENGWIMIHNASGGAWGESEDLRKTADLLDGLTKTIRENYAKNTKLSEDEIVAMMDEEAWLDAEAALEKGFVDTIGAEIKAVACLDTKRFLNAPSGLFKAQAHDNQKPNTKDKSMIDKNVLVNRGIVRPSASDEDALSQLETFVNEAKTNKAALEDANTKLSEAVASASKLQEKIDAQAVEISETKAQAAVDSGKITAEQKADYLELLNEAPALAEKFLNTFKKPVAPSTGTDPVNVKGGDSDGNPDTPQIDPEKPAFGQTNWTEQVKNSKARQAAGAAN